MSIFLFRRIKRPRRHLLDRVLSMSKSTRNARTAQLFELVLIFLDSFNIISRNIFVCRLKFSLLKIIRKSLFWSSAQTLNRIPFLTNHMAIMPPKCFIQALASSLSKNSFLVGRCRRSRRRITLLEWKRTQRIRALHFIYYIRSDYLPSSCFTNYDRGIKTWRDKNNTSYPKRNGQMTESSQTLCPNVSFLPFCVSA